MEPSPPDQCQESGSALSSTGFNSLPVRRQRSVWRQSTEAIYSRAQVQMPHLHVEFWCSYLALHAAELSSKLVLQSVGQLVVNWTRHLLLTSLFIQDLQHTEETASVWTLTEEEECERLDSVMKTDFCVCQRSVMSVRTWLCSCEASLACCVSRVSGSRWYRGVDVCFLLASLYLVWNDTTRNQNQVQCLNVMTR